MLNTYRNDLTNKSPLFSFPFSDHKFPLKGEELKLMLNIWQSLASNVEFISNNEDYLRATKLWVIPFRELSPEARKKGSGVSLKGKGCYISTLQSNDNQHLYMPFGMSLGMEVYAPEVKDGKIVGMNYEELVWEHEGENIPWNVSVNFNPNMCREIILGHMGPERLMEYYVSKGFKEIDSPEKAINKLRLTPGVNSWWNLMAATLMGSSFQLHMMVQISSRTVHNGVVKPLYGTEGQASESLAYHYSLQSSDIVSWKIVSPGESLYIPGLGMARSIVNVAKRVTNEVTVYSSPGEVPYTTKQAERNLRNEFGDWEKKNPSSTQEEQDAQKELFLKSFAGKSNKLAKWIAANPDTARRILAKWKFRGQQPSVANKIAEEAITAPIAEVSKPSEASKISLAQEEIVDFDEFVIEAE